MFLKEEEKAAGEPAKVGTLKLSEAIRKGAKKREQCIGDYFDGGRSCALGAAWEGFGHRYTEHASLIGSRLMHQHFVPSPIVDQIIRLNDNGHTREQIADWLEAQGL